MNYSAHPVSRRAFKAQACIDWLALVVTTTRPTQFQHIQATLRELCGSILWVEALDAQDGGVATTFSITFPDHLANSCHIIQGWLDALSARYPFAGMPTIRAIEVACDFRHKAGSARDTLAMTHRLQSSLFAPAGTKPRQFDPIISGNRYLDNEGARINPEWNFRIGNEWDYLSWQAYFKRTDATQALPKSQWRARVEVTLRGDALRRYELNSLDDIARFRFDRLTGLFRFRRPIDPNRLASGDLYKLTAIIANRRVHDATPERGIHSFDRVGRKDYRWRNTTRAESRHLEPDHELQDAVKGALKRLNPLRKKLGQIKGRNRPQSRASA